MLVAVVNVASKQLHEVTGGKRYLNIADGVILTEAILYALDKAKRYLGLSLSYLIFDIKGSRMPFTQFYFNQFLSIASSYQILPHLFLRQQQNSAPFVNVLPLDAVDEEQSGNGKGQITAFAAVPPKKLEIKAIIDILSRLNWRFVSVIASRDEGGERLVKDFSNLAFQRGICIGTTVWMSNTATLYEISKAVKSLKNEKDATVVISFLGSVVNHGILNSAIHGFNFISGTNFRASRNEMSFRKEAAKGLLLLQHDDTYDEEFKKHFINIRYSTRRYPWFTEFWSEIFKCQIPFKQRSSYAWYKKYNKFCTGNEQLTDRLVDLRYALVKPVLNAVQSLACGLKQSIMAKTCDRNMTRWNDCRDEISVNSSKYFGQSDCSWNITEHFNKDGYVMKKYRILNFDGSDYKDVGSWYYNETIKEGVLNLSVDKITWNWEKFKTTACYNPCNIDEIGFDGKVCCDTCRKCSGIDEIIRNNTCVKCETYQVRAPSRTSCIPLPRIFIVSNATPIVAIEIAAITGVFLTVVTIIILVRYRDSRVVKSIGKDLSTVMMISVVTSFSTSVIFFLKPTVVVCGGQKILLGQCLGAYYIPLLLKTIRINRIFEASKNFIRNPMLVSTKSLLILCMFGVLANLLLGILLVFSQPPKVNEVAIENNTKVAVHCNHSPVDAVTSLVPCLLLLLACTYFGYKTRKFPSNFNESFRISVTMYISCFLWGVYIPLLYLFQNSRQADFMANIVTAGLMVTLGFVNLVGMFGATLLKAIKREHIRPEILVESFNFGKPISENATSAVKSYKDIGTDPIEF